TPPPLRRAHLPLQRPRALLKKRSASGRNAAANGDGRRVRIVIRVAVEVVVLIEVVIAARTGMSRRCANENIKNSRRHQPERPARNHPLTARKRKHLHHSATPLTRYDTAPAQKLVSMPI